MSGHSPGAHLTAVEIQIPWITRLAPCRLQTLIQQVLKKTPPKVTAF